MSETDASLLLMPVPLHLTLDRGRSLAMQGPLVVGYTRVRTARLERAVARLPMPGSGRRDDGPPLRLTIRCDAASAPHPALDDDEAYNLSVSAGGVHIEAAAEWGVLRALATLTQLWRPELPALHVADSPRFPWRGLMLDVARHFFPLDDLLRTLDTMAAFKLNVLHLHLSDDQGFRFPSRRFPRLPSEQHYTPDELGRLVTQASDRGIRVVPELDVPGHTTCWLRAYPRWGNREAEPTRRFGVHRGCLDPTRPEVKDAVAVLFGELAEVFPDRYLHFGGDEVSPVWWTEDETIRSFMDHHGLADAAALQGRFNRHLTDALRGLGRQGLGWDEVLNADLPGPVAVEAWRGVTARDRALAAGHDCVLAAPYYLDLSFPADVHYRFDPAAPQRVLLAEEDALLDDPRLAHVAEAMKWTHQWRNDKVDDVPGAMSGRLLGAEACLWSELVDARVLDVRLWSRMPALAERFWSAPEHCVPDHLPHRLDGVLQRLPAWARVDVAGDSERLTAEAGVTDGWRPLVEMLEPVRWYARLLGADALAARLSGTEMPQARPYDLDTPLNRVVDGLPPESLRVRHLTGLTRAEAQGDPEARDQLRDLARSWQQLPEVGGPAELEEPARKLRGLGAMMVGVLAGELHEAQALARLARAAGPSGEYLLAPVPVLARWLRSRSQSGSADD